MTGVRWMRPLRRAAAGRPSSMPIGPLAAYDQLVMTGVRWMRPWRRAAAARTSSMPIALMPAIIEQRRRAGYTSRMRTLVAVAVSVLLVQGCSLVNIDLQPRIRPLEEETVEGKGKAKILLMDV